MIMYQACKLDSERGNVKYFTFFIIAAGLLFSGCDTKTYTMLQQSGDVVRNVSDENFTQESSFEWKLAKGDRVEIIVANQSVGDGDQQLNVLLNTAGRGQQYQTRDGTEGILIPADGTVRLPLVGVIEVGGLTESKAADKLTTAYKQYLKNPFVSVKILNQKLFVLGEVRKPGVVQVTNGTMTLFEALAYSGDLNDDASRTNVKIIRGGTRTPQVREVNLSDLSTMKLTSLILLPNDIIYVQPRGMKAYNVAFKEQTPFFDMIHAMLLPFVDFKIIKDGYGISSPF
jgi:polysaccharide export outer membrane protein